MLNLLKKYDVFELFTWLKEIVIFYVLDFMYGSFYHVAFIWICVWSVVSTPPIRRLIFNYGSTEI